MYCGYQSPGKEITVDLSIGEHDMEEKIDWSKENELWVIFSFRLMIKTVNIETSQATWGGVRWEKI